MKRQGGSAVDPITAERITVGAGEGGAGVAGDVGRRVTRADALRISRQILERAEQERRPECPPNDAEDIVLQPLGWQLAVAKEAVVANKPTDYIEANIVLAALGDERDEVERLIGELSSNEQVALAAACQVVVGRVHRVRGRARVERSAEDD